jgi:hypothetical protein
MRGIIQEVGFEVRSEAQTMAWAITIYSRPDVSLIGKETP